jgi:signal transduction histidine kinase
VHGVVQFVEYVNLALYTVVAIAAVWLWRRHREVAGLWAALSFGLLAFIVDVGPLLPDDPQGFWEELAIRALIAGLVVFPFLLFRFAVTFRPPSRRLSLVLGGVTGLMVLWTFALPEIPGEGESWPASFAVYVLAFTIHWTVLTIVVTQRLWTAGRGEASVPRRRMQLFAFASAAITLALIIAAAGPGEDSVATLVSSLLSTTSALAFLIGLAPPSALRVAWRRPETVRLQAAIADLMGATSTEQVVEHVLPPMAEIVGAHGIELHDTDGNVLGAFGDRTPGNGRVVAIEAESGTVKLWTSMYTPFFGADELAVVRTLVALTALALDRARLFAEEQRARVELERADEIKTNFISLAAHELRTPAGTIHGLVETIQGRRDDLDARQLTELELVLRDQAARMKTLVEQLLDLSRLEADAVEIRPTALAVRPCVEEIVAAAAGENARSVEIDVDPRLVAHIDTDALDRILSNLIVNAFRYGAPPVTITAQQNDRHFRLTVEDRGEGVSPEFVPDLFERFTRSRGARARTGGTGLGLAIARSYAQAHRGDLIYAPAHPQGARFQLVLPVERR